MSELAKRILFALPAAILFLYVTVLGGIYFTMLIAIIAMFIQYEMNIISSKAGFKPDPYFIYSTGLYIVLFPDLPYAPAIGLAIFLIFIAMQVFKSTDQAVEEMISTAFCGIYAPFGLMMLVQVRGIGMSDQLGMGLLVALLFMVWGNDVFAYFGGKATGKRLLAPKISPNKTWEGFLFGILGAGVGYSIVYYWLPVALPFSTVDAIPAILLVSIFGPLGDLTISKIKRAANIKDASNILPGHGGFLDRFDALILAAPAFYLYVYVLKVLGYVAF